MATIHILTYATAASIVHRAMKYKRSSLLLFRFEMNQF